MIFRTFSAALWLLVSTCLINETQAHVVLRAHKAVSSASLARRGNSHSTLDFAAERKGLQAKYGGKQSKRHNTRQNIIQEDMVNQNMDVMYYAMVEVGTPPQSYAVILDTGSSDMWLQSVDCAPCTGKKINATISSTLQRSSSPFSIAYGIGSVKGTLVNDVVSIGSSSEFTVQNQVWGLVNYTLGTPVPGDIAGLMGLGFKNLAASQATPFWEALVSENKWHDPVMSFWMTRYSNVSTANAAEFGGEFILGGTNEALYSGDIEFISLSYASNPTFWAIPIHSITVNGNDISAAESSASSALAAIDTATSLIGGPASVVGNLYAAIPGAQRGQGVLEGFWTFPCSEKVELTLNFGGRAWAMASDDFALTTDISGTCVGAIFETSLGDPDNSQIPQWYIGASFLKNVYSVFRYDPPAVGFAQLSTAALKGEPVPLSADATNARSAHSSGASNGAGASLSSRLSALSIWQICLCASIAGTYAI
ncbi:aspartic protease [Rhizoctonia solani AG-3 Rhs1AP]|uniref:Aspartic protease n=1 Tax=Rhizoctonia solani AG-3 Rhs1AP TaxID=1086054 RepID=X8J8L7_9AGAM|nr:aspartic protease [Rhizoctonia solani AG-3 Rhs1AP]